MKVLSVFVLTLLVLAAPAYAATVLELNMDTVSNDITPDASGNSLDGYLYGAVHLPAEGRPGGALSFDGTDDFLNVSYNSLLDFATAENITVTAWINPTTLSPTFQVFLVKGRTSGTNTENYALRTAGDDLEFYYRNDLDTAWHVYTAPDALVTDTWQHVALTFTFGLGTPVLYVDGVAVAGSWTVGDGTESPAQSAEDLWVGAIDIPAGSSVDQPFSGLIDEVTIYDEILLAGEVETIYNAGIPADISLEFLYRIATDRIRVQGYAPTGALSTEVLFEGPTATHTSACMAVLQGATPEFHGDAFTPEASGWPVESYFAKAKFYEGTACNGTQITPNAFGGEFDWLKINQLMNDLDALEILVNETNATLQAQIDALQATVINLSTDLDALELEVDTLASLIQALSHGTVDLFHEYDGNATNSLRVKGEAPLGADEARICINPVSEPISSGSCYRQANVAVGTVGGNENQYVTLFTDLNTWDADKYNVVVRFYDGGVLMTGYGVHTLFDDLLIVSLQAQLLILEDELGALNASLQAQIDDLQLQLDDVNANLTLIWSEIQALYDQFDLQNHGTMSYHVFNASSTYNPDSLRVWGEAPFGAQSVTVELRLLDRTVVYSETVPVTSLGVNDNSYEAFFTPLSSFDKVPYQIRVFFNDGSDVRIPGYDVGAMFNDLYLEALTEWLETHEAWLITIDGQIADLNTTVQNHTAWLIDIDNNLSMVWSEIGLIQGNISDLHANDTAQQIQIDDLIDRVNTLESEVSDLWDAITLLNHGDLDLVWDETDRRLRAKIKFPLGATKAELYAYDKNDVLSQTYGTVFPLADNYVNVDWDVSGWEKQTYTIKVKFLDGGDDVVGRWVSELFDNLYMEYLNERITDVNNTLTLVNETLSEQVDLLWLETDQLWMAIDAAQHGTINVRYYASEETLVVDGEAPAGAVEARLCVFDNTLSEVAQQDCANAAHVSSYESVYTNFDNSLYYKFAENVGSLDPNVEYNLVVKFFNATDDEMGGYDVSAEFNTLSVQDLEWRLNDLINWLDDFISRFYGIENGYTFEVFNAQSDFDRMATFGYVPPRGLAGQYEFRLITNYASNGESLDQTLWSCPGPGWISDQEVNTVISTWTLPPTSGYYEAQLVAIDCTTMSIKGTSPEFSVEVIDLAEPLPNNTVGVSELLGIQQGLTGIYWTADTHVTFDVLMQSSTGWSSALDCIVRYDDGLGGDLVRLWDMTVPNATNISSCGGTLPVEEITNLNGDGPWNLTVCAEPKQHNPNDADELCDSLEIGYDAIPPVINESSLNPGVLDAVSGNWTFSAEVSDNGEVATVWFDLINKTNATDVCSLGYATYNGSIWELEYDTAAGCSPDGYYNFSVTATDVAGNVAVLEIDPLIDNTAPVVQSIVLSGYGGQNMSIDATLTDNLAGVLSATATITRYMCDSGLAVTVVANSSDMCELNCTKTNVSSTVVNLSQTGGTSFNGVWSGSFEADSGWYYEVSVDAEDGAGNNAVAQIAQKIAQAGYVLVIDTNKDSYTTDEQVSVSGTIVATDGSTVAVDGLTIDGVAVPVMSGAFGNLIGPLAAGDHIITATYTPSESCTNDSFTATTTVSVSLATGNNGGSGGGGGGGSFHPLQTTGGEGEDAPEEPEEEVTSSNTENEVESGNTEPTQENEEPVSQPETQEETQSDNLITGAVTGAGFFANNWPWLAVLGGLILLLLGGYKLSKR